MSDNQDVSAEQAQEAPQLTIQDLQAVARIIELASSRGAFQANELAQIGTAYNKVTQFLEYIASIQPPAADSKE